MGFWTNLGKPADQVAAANIRRGARAAGSQRKIRAPKKAAPAQFGKGGKNK
jgi:hypothetical protein